MLKHIFSAVQTKLRAIPELAYVSEDWGQLDKYDAPPVDYPLALFDLSEVDYIDRSLNSQTSSCTIRVRLADLPADNISAEAEDDGNSGRMYDLIGSVFSALQGLDGEGFDKLTRTRIERTRREDGIREYSMYFACNFVDGSAVDERHTATLGLLVTRN